MQQLWLPYWLYIYYESSKKVASEVGLYVVVDLLFLLDILFLHYLKSWSKNNSYFYYFYSKTGRKKSETGVRLVKIEKSGPMASFTDKGKEITFYKKKLDGFVKN